MQRPNPIQNARPATVTERAPEPLQPAPDATPAPPGTPAALVLADGRAFEGFAIGAAGEVFGELVFNTAMTGYQEVLTDPSYRGQLVTMTYPHIGNYGIQPREGESDRPQLAGLVVRKASRRSWHRSSAMTLGAYLARYGLTGIEGIDTRALVRHIRDTKAQAAVLTTKLPETNGPLASAQIEALAERAAAWGAQVDWGLGRTAGAGRPYVVEPREHADHRGKPPVVVALDLGIKAGIVQQLSLLGCRVHVVPPTWPSEAIKRIQPDGIFLSNGPGDPSDLTEVVDTVADLLGHAPLFGICLGHQLLALALGGKVEKMRFGHRGANHPVLDRTTGRIEITSQNHGYHVLPDTLPDHVEVTHVNLNDGTVEGLQAASLGAFSVQYHPEACPGPHDAHHHFLRFIDQLRDHMARG